MQPQFKRQTGPEQRPLVGWLYQLLGLSIFIAGIPLSHCCVRFNDETFWTLWGKQLGSIIFVAFLALVLCLPFYLYLRGHRHFVRSATSAIMSDARRPVIYLRSFAHEQAFPFEGQLATIFRSVGPFVAIGNPGDQTRSLAAYRDYVPDDEWQGYVTKWLSEARLVVMHAAGTPGLSWELRQCRKRLHPSQLIILLSPNENDYLEFSHLAENCGLTMPPYPRSEQFGGLLSGLPGIVTFDDAWVATMREVLRYEVSSRLEPVVDGLEFVLHDIFRSRGIKLSRDSLQVPLLRLASKATEHWRLAMYVAIFYAVDILAAQFVYR